MNSPWGKKAVRVAIAIGKDADSSILEQFTGNKEQVLEAKNPQDLVKFIKWVSTAVVQIASAPKVGASETPVPVMDMGSIPVSADNDDDIW
jgi:uncharacterized protein YegL